MAMTERQEQIKEEVIFRPPSFPSVEKKVVQMTLLWTQYCGSMDMSSLFDRVLEREEMPVLAQIFEKKGDVQNWSKHGETS